jgi:hypothetical protein
LTGMSEAPYHIHDVYSCPRGAYCEDSSIAFVNCGTGTYQPKYGATSVDDCLEVPEGFYNDEVGQYTFMDKPCPSAFWCEGNISNPKTLDDGTQRYCAYTTFRSYTQAKEEGDCADCPSGFFCPEATTAPYRCPQGYYCPLASEFPIACPTGTYGPGEGLIESSDCAPCYGGRYCEAWGLANVEGGCD